MHKMLLLTLIVTLAAGCARVQNSAVNPFNWFGRSTTSPVATAEAAPAAVNPLIPRSRASIFRNDDEEEIYLGTLVADVDELVVERVPGGAVIRASGTATGLDAFDVRLVPDPAETTADTLSYQFRAVQPPRGRGRGSESARSLVVAVNLTDQDLAGIRTIRIASASNVRTTSR